MFSNVGIIMNIVIVIVLGFVVVLRKIFKKKKYNLIFKFAHEYT